MADVKISALTELTTPADTDELNIVDKSDTSFASTGTNKRIKVENLRGASAAQVTAIEANTAKVGITDAQADAIQQNTAKHGLYEFHANRVGRFRGVSGNPDTNTTIASGTAQFDGGDLYLSRTDVDGNNIGASLDAITGGTITIGGLTGTVSGNSANATRNAISVNWTNNVAPIANEGHIFSLFTGNANITEYGVYTDDTTLEKNGSQEEPLKVKARGINTDHLDTPTNGSVGQVIKRTQGANTMAWEDETTELPAVTTADNGDVLTVVAGAWNKAAVPAGSLPTVTSADNGEVLTVVGGAWAAAAAPSGGGTGTPLVRDVLATQSTFAATNAGLLNANIDLASGKTLVGHDDFVVSFKYTHSINFNGHNFSTTNEFSKVYDGNVFRSFTGGKQPVEEVYTVRDNNGLLTTNTVRFSIQRSTDTRVTVSFISNDSTRTFNTISDFEITGRKYPVGGSGSGSVSGSAGWQDLWTPTAPATFVQIGNTATPITLPSLNYDLWEIDFSISPDGNAYVPSRVFLSKNDIEDIGSVGSFIVSNTNVTRNNNVLSFVRATTASSTNSRLVAIRGLRAGGSQVTNLYPIAGTALKYIFNNTLYQVGNFNTTSIRRLSTDNVVLPSLTLSGITGTQNFFADASYIYAIDTGRIIRRFNNTTGALVSTSTIDSGLSGNFFFVIGDIVYGVSGRNVTRFNISTNTTMSNITTSVPSGQSVQDDIVIGNILYQTSGSRIYRTNVATGAALTPSVATLRSPVNGGSISPSYITSIGNFLYFSTFSTSNNSIYKMNASTLNIENIVHTDDHNLNNLGTDGTNIYAHASNLIKKIPAF